MSACRGDLLVALPAIDTDGEGNGVSGTKGIEWTDKGKLLLVEEEIKVAMEGVGVGDADDIQNVLGVAISCLE